ncbi:MAG: hypothetical protein AB7O44_12890 [Hyphomicrobiaceae bacterium]
MLGKIGECLQGKRADDPALVLEVVEQDYLGGRRIGMIVSAVSVVVIVALVAVHLLLPPLELGAATSPRCMETIGSIAWR